MFPQKALEFQHLEKRDHNSKVYKKKPTFRIPMFIKIGLEFWCLQKIRSEF